MADELGRNTRDVYVHTVFIGGAFGANGGGNTAVTRQAAILSRQLRRPVKVIWSREEDIALDKQRPPHYTRLSVALDDDGLPEAFFSRAVRFPYRGVSSHGSATADYAIGTMPYRVPNRRHDATMRTATYRSGLIARQALTRMALSSSSSSMRWRSPATGTRLSGAWR